MYVAPPPSIYQQFKVFTQYGQLIVVLSVLQLTAHLPFLVEHDSVLGFHPFILFRRNLKIEQYPILVRHRLQVLAIAQVTVAGANIEYATWGEVGKPGIVLIHGSKVHLEWWRFTAPFWVDRFR